MSMLAVLAMDINLLTVPSSTEKESCPYHSRVVVCVPYDRAVRQPECGQPRWGLRCVTFRAVAT